MKRIILLLIIALSLGSCNLEKKVFLRSYVMEYYDAEDMELEEISYDGSIRIVFKGLSSLGDYTSTGWLKRSYDALCEKHNDMTFNRKFVISDAAGPISTEILGIDFISIDIVSDADYDEDHPSGESLGDVVFFISYSLKPYIDDGYRGEIHYPVYDLVSEITSEQLIPLGQNEYIGLLRFNSLPTLSKTHTFTVTVTADDGRVFSDSIEMVFE